MKSNRTIATLDIERQEIVSPELFNDRLKKKLTTENTIFETSNNYELELIEGSVADRAVHEKNK
jgi:hypothetical protein